MQLVNAPRLSTDFMTTDMPLSLEQVESLLNTSKTTVSVAADDTDNVGFVIMSCLTPPEFSHRAKITALSVLPHARGRGIATALMSHAIAHARHIGLASLSLDVVADNAPAIAIYKTLGFKQCGTLTKAFCRNGICHDIQGMSRSLLNFEPAALLPDHDIHDGPRQQA